jgi:hypothetical protein
MEPTPTAAARPRPTGGPPRHPTRRRHPAARSRVVAGALSAVLFLGLGAGMAARQTSADTTTSAAVSGSAGTHEDTGSASSGWAATPGSSSDASAMTSSQGS